MQAVFSSADASAARCRESGWPGNRQDDQTAPFALRSRFDWRAWKSS